MVGMVLRNFWKKWVFDSEQLPIKWNTHPHCAFKVIARFAVAFLGSITPYSLVLLLSGVPGQLDKGAMQIGWVFGFMAAAIVATWLWSVIWATRSEENRLRKHAVIASIVPANITVVLMAVQSTV